MNKRQAKKRYKKLNDHNPDRHKLEEHLEQVMSETEVREKLEEIGKAISDGFINASSALCNAVAAASEGLGVLAKSLESFGTQAKEPPVVVAEALGRKRRINNWKKIIKRHRRIGANTRIYK